MALDEEDIVAVLDEPGSARVEDLGVRRPDRRRIEREVDRLERIVRTILLRRGTGRACRRRRDGRWRRRRGSGGRRWCRRGSGRRRGGGRLADGGDGALRAGREEEEPDDHRSED